MAKGRKAKEAEPEALLTAADPALGRMIEVVVARAGQQRVVRPTATSFEALVRAVVYQQMAENAAAVIYKNVQTLGGPKLTPQAVLSLTSDELRAAGMSGPKAKYVRNLAEWFDLHADVAVRLPDMPNDEVIATLTSIPGVGMWTANMFLIFTLSRPDVVPTADLGIRRGVQLAYALPELASPDDVLEKSERWKPHRSLASLYLWSAVKLKLTAADLIRAP